jgi:hypothetical protein
LSLDVPVVFVIFNRPAHTERVFAAIAQAKPGELHIVADGPRADHPEDPERCAAARKIVERVDWPCQVHKLFAEKNMGVDPRVHSGVTEVFAASERAIVLEDDCVPHPSFFPYCAELLERYRDDERIMTISGSNYLRKSQRTPYSYFFSRYTCTWGWASWRRAWRLMDFEMKLWPTLRDSGWLADMLSDCPPGWRRKWERNFGEGLWDYCWSFACWSNSALTILPQVNLVSNIGSGVEATHCFDPHAADNLPVEELAFPLKHPPFVLRDKQADDLIRHAFEPSLINRAVKKLRRLMK